MTEYNPCESCWINLGNCNGLGLLGICCGTWCCKGPIMEQHDPNCCYCFEFSGIGCNLCCLGCVCCHPPWFNGYMQKYFYPNPQNQPQPQPFYPTPNPTYFPENPNPNPQYQNNYPQYPSPNPQFQNDYAIQDPNVYQDIQYVESPAPIIRDPQNNHAF